MKRNRKLLLTVLSLALVLVIGAAGTFAYLTDTDSAVNTFTVGQVDISLDEAKVDTDGKPIEGADRVQENEYHLVPGQTYVKDPTITVKAGSEPSYVRMMVTLNNAADLKEIFGEEFLPQNYVTGWDSEQWLCVGIGEDAEADTIIYEFRYYETVSGKDEDGENADTALPALFETITVPGEVTGEQLAKLGDFKITVEGHAIQAAGFETADAAWEAFDAQVKDAVNSAENTGNTENS